ncbi:MAG: UDP-N-acetylglucosamine 2-epimerase (non-hydrolyzing) [Anaerolineales bacterium]
MKIISIVGARPQFIKAAPVSIALAKNGFQEYLVHTGQHYDYGMSEVFFKELGIAEPSINLGVGSGTHAQQTGRMLIELEAVLESQKPDLVLVYGDTNSTLAGAIASVKLHIKLAHVEAGLRSYNREMPEEHNRVLTDHCADLLFCPTQSAIDNLTHEGIRNSVFLVGDTMYDAILLFSRIAAHNSKILQTLKLVKREYLLTTIHRAYNTDHIDRLKSIFIAFQRVNDVIVFPIHPRTRLAITASRLSIPDNVKIIEPIGYLDMLMLEQNARIILTDSGGMQKEAYFFHVPCLTLRLETEWIETVTSGWNKLVDCDQTKIIQGINMSDWPSSSPTPFFGDGNASQKIVNILSTYDNSNLP